MLDEELTMFIEAQVGEQFFPSPDHLEIWQMIIDHYQQYGKPPSQEVIHKAYPTYEFFTYPEPTSFYLNALRQDRKKKILIDSVQEIYNRVNNQAAGPALGDDIEELMRQGLGQAAHEISQSRDTNLFLSGGQILERFLERRKNPNHLRGITTGMDGMDRITAGLQPQQLITLIGIPKAGKSSVLLKIALSAHQSGLPVLFLTFEMSTEEQEDRTISLISGVGLTPILNGTTSNPEAKLVADALKVRKNADGFIISSDITSATTVSGVQAKIRKYQPALVIIDGAYLMDDESGFDKGTPQALTSLTRAFKRLAQVNKLPILVSTQAMIYRARGGLNQGSIAYSSSFAQDSDIIFGVEQHENLPSVSKFSVVSSRSSAKGYVNVHFDWSRGLVEELSDEEHENMLNNLPTAQAQAGSSSKTTFRAP